MSISIKCTCGKTLKVDEKHRGKKAKCPECGKLLLIEEESDEKAETAVQAEKPRKRPVAADDDDGDSDVRKPIKRKNKKKVAQRSMTPWILGGCGVLTVLTCCLAGLGGGLWYFLFRGPDADLIYVHDGVAGFMSIRIGDGWKNPKFKDQFKVGLGRGNDEFDKKLAEVETKLGIKLEEVERVTMIVRSADLFLKNDKDQFAAVVRTSKAMDRKKIIEYAIKELNAKEKQVQHEGNTIHVLDDGGGAPMVLFFPTDRIVVITPSEAGMKDALRQAKNPPKHAAIARGVKMASSGKYTIVAAMEVKKDFMNKVPEDFMKQVPNLRDLTGVIVSGTVASDESEAILTFPSKEMAAKGKTDVDTLVTLMKAGLKAQKKELPPALQKTIDSISINQSGEEVVVKIKADPNLKDLGDLQGFGFPGRGGGDFGGAGRMQSVNNLKQIALAIQGFNDANKSLPNHAVLHPKTGQPLLSWRVAILPYLDQQPLYNQIRQNESWDSPHNRQFSNKIPAVYHLPGKLNDGRTYYQVFHGSESAFPKTMRPPNFPGSGVSMVNITDGTSNTIFVAETGASVNWMQPDDIPFQMNDQGLMNRLGNHWGDNTFNAAMGDGTVRAFRRDMPALTLQALITRNGGEVVDVGKWTK